jgi:hypothetical protein
MRRMKLHIFTVSRMKLLFGDDAKVPEIRISQGMLNHKQKYFWIIRSSEWILSAKPVET